MILGRNSAIPLNSLKKLDAYENHRQGWKKSGPFQGKQKEPESKVVTGQTKATFNVSDTGKVATNPEFDKRFVKKCFVCKSTQHLARQCPNKRVEPINHACEPEASEILKPYTLVGKINQKESLILRDSGASFDLVSESLVNASDYTGESIWISQPLERAPKNLCVAQIELEIPSGRVITRAAVVPKECELAYYILSNRTMLLLEEVKQGFVEPQEINVVVTRASAAKEQFSLGNSVENVVQNIEINRSENDVEEEENTEAISAECDSVVELASEIRDLLRVDTNQFRRAQQADGEVKAIYDECKTVNSEPGKDMYFIKNDILFKNRRSKKGENFEMLVVPKIYRGDILRVCHETASSHLGCSKSKSCMSRYFYWPNCFQEMEKFVKTCNSCQLVGHGGDKKKAPLIIVPTISEVFSKLNIDTVGPFAPSSTGAKHILTAICVSSRYPEAIPIRDLQTTTIIEALMELFSRTGFPREMQTDQGTCFTSNLMVEFAEKFGIRIVHSSSYHPQSNSVERIHRTMNRLFKVLCLEAGGDWEMNLPAILFAMRTTVHESLGYTPAELVFGKNLRTPVTLLYENIVGNESESNTVTEYVFELINRLKYIRETAHLRLEGEQRKRKVAYDKKAVVRNFNVGDKVLIFAPNRTKKLSVQWIGPGEVMEKVSDVNYLVQLPNKSAGKVYHVNMMKAYHQRTEYVNFVAECRTEDEANDDVIDRYALRLEAGDFDAESMLIGTDATPEMYNKLKALIVEFSDIFSDKPGLTDKVEMDIELVDNTAKVRSAPYRMSMRQSKILQEEIAKMLRDGIIESSDSDFASPMILVETPNKKPRACVDYRKLNQVIKTEYFPLPSLDERIETVAAAKIISTCDLSKGFWQVKMTERAQRYATFCTKFGSYKPLRMPFGIKNAPYVCSKLMAALLKDCSDFAIPYMDDIAIFSNDWTDHLRHLRIVFNILREAKLHIQPAKCKFARGKVMFLGYEIGSGLLKPNEIKVRAIREYPRPTTKKEIRKFLGFISYYRRFVPRFSEKAAPLTDLLKGTMRQGKVAWSQECEKAFIELRDALCSEPVIHAPDFNREFLMQCDASDRGVGIVLSQVDDDGNENPVLFLSKKFSPSEIKYCVTEKECASIIWGLQKLKHYIDGNVCLKVETDHNPLVWLQQCSGNNPRLMRWSLAIQHLNIKIKHRKGNLNINADILSRVYENELQAVPELAERRTSLSNVRDVSAHQDSADIVSECKTTSVKQLSTDTQVHREIMRVGNELKQDGLAGQKNN